MDELLQLVQRRNTDGSVARVARNPRRQFGAGQRALLGATIMPERPVDENTFRDDYVKYRSLPAVDADRYSPVEMREGAYVGSVLVELMENSTGSQLKAKVLDAINKLLGQRNGPAATAQLTQWEDTMLARPLSEKNEIYRWQAITNAVVQRVGSNGARETVQFPNPPGVRTVAGTPWSDPTYDPFPDIVAHKTRMAEGENGIRVARQITSTRVLNILLANPKMQVRIGAAVQVNGTLVPAPGGATLERINAYMRQNDLPDVEVYDLTYALNAGGTQRFMRNDVWVMIGETGQTEDVDLEDGEFEQVENTIGYIGIGTVATETAPGKVIRTWVNERHPRGVAGEAVQTSGPVMNAPEDLGVITNIN